MSDIFEDVFGYSEQTIHKYLQGSLPNMLRALENPVSDWSKRDQGLVVKCDRKSFEISLAVVQLAEDSFLWHASAAVLLHGKPVWLQRVDKDVQELMTTIMEAAMPHNCESFRRHTDGFHVHLESPLASAHRGRLGPVRHKKDLARVDQGAPKWEK